MKKSTRLRWSPGVSAATMPVSSSTRCPPPPTNLARGPGRALKKLTRLRWSPGVSVATMPVSSSTRCGAGGSRKKCATRPQALLGSVTRTRMLPARARAAGLAP